jgi:hypothetical protein
LRVISIPVSGWPRGAELYLPEFAPLTWSAQDGASLAMLQYAVHVPFISVIVSNYLAAIPGRTIREYGEKMELTSRNS